MSSWGRRVFLLEAKNQRAIIFLFQQNLCNPSNALGTSRCVLGPLQTVSLGHLPIIVHVQTIHLEHSQQVDAPLTDQTCHSS